MVVEATATPAASVIAAAAVGSGTACTAASIIDRSDELRPDAAARYALVDEVLAMTKQAGVQSMGFVGNDAYMRAF